MDASDAVTTESVCSNSAVTSITESVRDENVTRNVFDISDICTVFGIGNGIERVPEHFLNEKVPEFSKEEFSQNNSVGGPHIKSEKSHNFIYFR